MTFKTEYYKILEDWMITKRFLNHILDDKPINDFEMYGITLAARNKYLNKPEDPTVNYPNLNGTTMFTRIFADSKNKNTLIDEIISKVHRLECAKGGYQVNAKFPDPISGICQKMDIPEETLMCYFYINPLNTSLGYKNFLEKLALFQQQAIDRIVSLENKKDSNFNIKKDIKRLHHLAEVAYTQSMGKKRWYDIDIDYKYDSKNGDDGYVLKYREDSVIPRIIVEYIRKGFEIMYNIDILEDKRFYLVKSHSGIHFGFRTSLLGELKCGPEVILNQLKNLLLVPNLYAPQDALGTQYKRKIFELYKIKFEEIKINKELQIPLPGTLQGGKLVEFLDKSWLEDKKFEMCSID